jgi:hypothetical protein
MARDTRFVAFAAVHESILWQSQHCSLRLRCDGDVAWLGRHGAGFWSREYAQRWIILIGVIGGTISYGITGLFLGPIVLVVIWELLVAWIRERESA